MMPSLRDEILGGAVVLIWRAVVACIAAAMAADNFSHELAGPLGLVAGAIIASQPFPFSPGSPGSVHAQRERKG